MGAESQGIVANLIIGVNRGHHRRVLVFTASA